ncbi:MAG: 50S ribosomal protein L10 [Actinobacteria bacterium]|nr:50S ribosomal protein L10 [Actinomycetota bacterium]
MSMENPRADKVAVVDEVREKFESSDAVLFTEYRGLTVQNLAELRASLSAVGGEYRVYKNTLVRLATKDLAVDKSFEDDLVGPTAIAFVGQKPDGTPGDAVMVAKALQAFAKSNPLLIIKGGLLGSHVLDAESAKALASVAPREELLSRLAGGIAAPMREFASLLQAIPASFAYGLKALIDAGGAAGAPVAEEVAAESVTEDTATEDTATEDAAAPEAAEEATAEVADPAPEETPETATEDSEVAQDNNETVADAAAEEE